MIRKKKTTRLIYMSEKGNGNLPTAIAEKYLESGNPSLRELSLAVLGCSRKAECSEVAMKSLEDDCPEVRIAAMETIEALRENRAVGRLVNILMYDDNFGVRSAAADVLGELGEVVAEIPLTKALEKDPSKKVRFCAARALGKLDTRKKLMTESYLEFVKREKKNIKRDKKTTVRIMGVVK